MTLENGKINFPYGNEERRVTSVLVEEMSMFAITERGKFEGIGAHDDMVMSLVRKIVISRRYRLQPNKPQRFVCRRISKPNTF